MSYQQQIKTIRFTEVNSWNIIDIPSRKELNNMGCSSDIWCTRRELSNYRTSGCIDCNRLMKKWNVTSYSEALAKEYALPEYSYEDTVPKQLATDGSATDKLATDIQLVRTSSKQSLQLVESSALSGIEVEAEIQKRMTTANFKFQIDNAKTESSDSESESESDDSDSDDDSRQKIIKKSKKCVQFIDQTTLGNSQAEIQKRMSTGCFNFQINNPDIVPDSDSDSDSDSDLYDSDSDSDYDPQAVQRRALEQFRLNQRY